ncbi:MAG: Do family serine endopeptidase [Hyphomicrobiaceae bacterium]
MLSALSRTTSRGRTKAGHRTAVALATLSAILVLAMPTELPARGGPQSVAPLAEKLIDAVVNISTSQTVKGPQGVPLPNVPKGSPFEEFFEDFFNRKGGQPKQDRKVSSLGSGFVIDAKEGLIVTNNHVIEGADEIIINFHDGSKLKVDKVIGRDTKTDLALLKVTPKKPLVAVKFGSSELLKVGDWVMAIGNPFGLGGSVSVGIISAKQRDINSGPYDDYLQTDAAINKGNSGGPLFSMDGDVIGVNTAIISPSGGSIGIGFAVPSDTALSVVEQLRQFGETRRGWLGVKIQTVTDDIAETLGVKENTGALISGVTPDGPAAKAGIKAGDVVIKFDGKDVATMRGLPRIVSQTQIGRSVDIEVLRKGQKIAMKVVVGRLQEDEDDKKKTAAADPGKPGDSKAAVLGMTLAPLTDELRKKNQIDAKVKGVLVTAVEANSKAAQKSIKAGDVIVEAAQEAVTSVEDINKAIDKVRKSGRKAVLLRVEDAKGDMRFVAVSIE